MPLTAYCQRFGVESLIKRSKTMTDTVVLAASSPQAVGSGSTNVAQSMQLDPHEAKTFAHMMQGTPVPAVHTSKGPGALSDVAATVASQLGGSVRSFEEIRRSMLSSVDMTDPIKTMFVMTDHSMEAHMMFAKLHVSTGLASAATGLFGNLLKNQQ
jgi:hypothetical protein